MVHDLDVVAVGIARERAVVAGVVFGPLAGSVVVAVASRRGGIVKRVDGRVPGCGKREMQVLGRRPRDEREGPGRPAELDPLGKRTLLRRIVGRPES